MGTLEFVYSACDVNFIIGKVCAYCTRSDVFLTLRSLDTHLAHAHFFALVCSQGGRTGMLFHHQKQMKETE